MGLNLRIALSIITIIYLLMILKDTRNKKILLSFSIFWIISAVPLIVAILFPGLIKSIATFLGFEVTSNMLFCVAIFISFYLIFNLTMKLSQEHEKNIMLIQEVSLLKDEVLKIKKDKEDVIDNKNEK